MAEGDGPVLDLLVLGSGVAGLSAAVRAADVHGLRVGILTKGQLTQAATRWAQGGVAAVLGGDVDSTDLHLADTLAAGADLCDDDAVRVLVDEGPARVNELVALGAIFDRDGAGHLLLAREGGHSHARVVHAGGAATGVEVERALVAAVRRTAAAVYEHWFALDLVVEGGRCAGVVARTPQGGGVDVRARNVLVATGGAGQLFAVTTNPGESTGDGIAMALRAGVAVADLEFVQFHPTALHHPSMPRPLLSEALRGHGALLRDSHGERFVDELLPRDKVSRAMTTVLADQGVDHVWLDATGIERFADRFPTIAAALAEVGLDPARQWLPVAPAAHYQCGGIVADLDGATSLPGLWVAGEAACNGVHGANRLASNSLLDGMVFGPRVVEAVGAGLDGPRPTGAMRCLLGGNVSEGATTRWVPGRPLLVPGLSAAPSTAIGEPGEDAASSPTATPVEDGTAGAPEGGATAARVRLQRSMTADAGVLRSADSLERAAGAVARAASVAGEGTRRRVGAAPSPAELRAVDELRNLATVGAALIAAARTRTESRGAHTRTDFPATAPGQRVRYVVGPPVA
ncbi:MAG TPA: FAD-binding protein [Acidimicrobiales bacterium]|nr:FAD-binding protein [Acidimicrobiales bacterium]